LRALIRGRSCGRPDPLALPCHGDGIMVCGLGRNGRNAGRLLPIRATSVDTKGNVYIGGIDT
jgi:hypothetical protein